MLHPNQHASSPNPKSSGITNARKRLLWVTLAAPMVAVTSLWAYTSVPIKAQWAEFGYYGHFNQVQRIIRSIPNLSIIDHLQHHDVTMEDFSFKLAYRNGKSFQIYFWEGTPQMKLTSDDEIRLYIEGVVAGHIKENKLEQELIR